jgi:chromosomal replication initiator protein
MNAWELVKQTLAASLSAESFENWVVRTSLARTEGETLYVKVPNEDTRLWLQQEYSSQIQQAIEHLSLPYRFVVYDLESTTLPRPATNPSHAYTDVAPSIESIFSSPTANLNPKFSFDNFVVGSCNQFAHAAAKAVAAQPSRSYNPLFIYGGVGMGKTHLMHAIGRKLIEVHPGMKVVYTSSEKFMNQMIQCIRAEKMTFFHQYYRHADILLIDDIQIIAGKERTQEEFFHTFNELFDNQKQIVISSDSPPKEVSGLVERLRSRFEWGLIVDVQPPDLETKMAILDQKAESEGIHLPEDVRIFLATRTKSNIRELEGALVKLLAYSSLTGMPITMEMAKQHLKHLTQGSEKRITIEAIVKAVAERFEMSPNQLKQKSNQRHIAYPRQIAMYLAKELTPASLPEIGRVIGDKHHTTVLHSVGKIDELRHNDPELNKLLHSLIDSFHS